MTVLGELALWIALPVAIWGMVLAFVGGKYLRGDLVLSAEQLKALEQYRNSKKG